MDGLDQPPAKVPRKDTDPLLCLICQQETNEDLVANPSKFNKVLDYIRKRATYGDRNFQEINRRIGDSTEETLLSQVATWHRSCYQDTCHPNMCKRAKERYEKQLAQKVKSPTAPGPSTSAPTFTRSHSNPYDSTLCFFCEEKSGRGNPLFTIRTDKAGWHLHSAIEKINNDKFRVKLSTAVNPKDAHAIDIQYHNKCWTAHVTNVIRKQTTEGSEHNAVDEVAADIEFISLVEETLLDHGNILSMSDLQEAYIDIRSANCVTRPECSRKTVKDIIVNEIPGVEFHKPRQRNKSELVSVKDTRDNAVQIASDSHNRNVTGDMKTLFEASIILRDAITQTERWSFSGALTDITEANVPKELYTFFRWVLQGTKCSLLSDLSQGKRGAVDKHAKILAESTVSHHLSDRQTATQSDVVRYRRETPTELGIASSQEEADTKLILHSVDATVNGATSIDIHSPDTDVLVLAIRRYPRLCTNTYFITGTAQKHRVVPLAPIYNTLGAKKAAALPGFHALSGADVTGRFAGKGKATFWKLLQELDSNDERVHALTLLGTDDQLPESGFAAIEAFVCKLYLPTEDLSSVADVRWWLFKKKQAQSEGLPPTQAALRPAIMRAHYQAIIWNSDIIANPTLPDPTEFGFDLVDGHYKPVMTSLPPAPQAVLDLVKCSCKKTRCTTNRCKCRKNGLNCTDLCSCCEDCESCDNSADTVLSEDEEDSDAEDA